METSSQTMGQFWKTCCIQCQKLVIAYHFMYCAAKLPKPLCQAPLYTITRLFQAWLPSRKPLQFSTKRRRQWPSQRTSSFTMKEISIWNSGQQPSQSFPFSLDMVPRGMPAVPSVSHWHSSLKPGMQGSRSSKQKHQRMNPAKTCLTKRMMSHQPKRRGALYQHHLWWPSLLVTKQWTAWSPAKGPPGPSNFDGAQPFGASALPPEAWHCHMPTKAHKATK